MSDGCELLCSDGSKLGIGLTDGDSLGVELSCDAGLELGPVLSWDEGTPDATRPAAIIEADEAPVAPPLNT